LIELAKEELLEEWMEDDPVAPHGFQGIDVTATDIYLHLVDPHGCTIQRSTNLEDQFLLNDSLAPASRSLLATVQHPTLGRLRQYTEPLAIDQKMFQMVVAKSLVPVDAALNALLRLFALFLPGAVILVSAGGYLLAGRALRPVNAVIDAARAIRAGDLSRRIALAGPPDEL